MATILGVIELGKGLIVIDGTGLMIGSSSFKSNKYDWPKMYANILEYGSSRKLVTYKPAYVVRVEVTLEEPAWVLAHSDGKLAFSGTLDAHEVRTVEGAKEVILRLGNAGAVSVLFNGTAVGPLGQKGQIRTVRFTLGGFEIVPPQ